MGSCPSRGSSRLTDNPEAHKLSIRQPPAALWELRIGLLPLGRLPPAGAGRDPGGAIEERPVAEDRFPFQVGGPLADVAQHVIETPLVRQFLADRMGGAIAVSGIPGALLEEGFVDLPRA